MSANFSGLNAVESGALQNPHKPHPSYQYNTSATAAGTFTAVQIAGADSVVYDHTGASPGTKTLPTVAVLVAQDPAYALSRSYKLKIINNQNTGALTIATAAGWTLTGSVIVQPDTWHEYMVTYTTAAAATLQFIGSGRLDNAPDVAFSTNATVADTWPVGEISGANLVITECTGGVGTKTLPTEALTIAGDPYFRVGRSYVLRIFNNSAGILTLNIADWAGTADLAIPANSVQEYLVTYTSATVVTINDISLGIAVV